MRRNQKIPAGGRLSQLLRQGATYAAVCAFVLLTPACAAVGDLTGDDRMRWTGDTASDDEVTLPVYQSVPAFPELTAPEAARAWGLRPPAGSSDAVAATDGWRVSVSQGAAATSVQLERECGQPVDDAQQALDGARAAYQALGGDPTTYEWFTVPDGEGLPRALGEPKLAGSPTWATGIVTATVSEAGLCSVRGTLMDFEQTEDTIELPSPQDAFRQARNDESLVVEGDYESAVPTWTLESEGRVIPAWRFIGEDHTIVMVDLGDGWETTLDTRSFLMQHPEE